MSTMALAAPPENLLPTTTQRLGKNPMLPGLPNTGDMDAQYLAEEAQLRAQVARQYADVLQQLGYIDPESGAFLPGTVSVAAGRQQSDLTRQSGIAGDQATDERVRGNAFFSGRTAENVERATQPYERQIAQLGVDTPLALGSLYEKAAGLIDQYTLQNNLYLANMAARRAAAIAKNPAGAPANQNPGGQQNTGGGDQNAAAPAPGSAAAFDQDFNPNLDQQLPAPIVNQNPGAPGQVFVPVTVGGQTSFEPKPNPGAYGQPDPVIISQGGPMAPGSQLVGPDEMPKPNPGSYGQPIPAMPEPPPEPTAADTFEPVTEMAPGSQLVGPDEMPKPNAGAYGQPIPDILEVINNAINATPAAAGQAAINVKPNQVPNASKKGNLI